MQSSRTKKIIIGVVVVAVALIGASLFKGSSGNPESTSGLVADRVDGPVGLEEAASNDEFFATLLNVRSIRIDTSLFNNPAFLYLKDHPVVLGTDTVGRPNPFAAIGTDSASVSTAPVIGEPSGASTAAPAAQPQTTGVETLQPGKITAASAELGAVVSFPNGTGPAVLVFDYGTTQDVSSSTESVILENGDRVLLPLSGLLPNTRYYVRASLLYGTQTFRGSIMSFTTKAQ